MTPQEFKDKVAGMEIKEEWKDAIVTVGIPTSYFSEEKEPSNKLLCGYYQEFVFEDGDTRKFLILSTRERNIDSIGDFVEINIMEEVK